MKVSGFPRGLLDLLGSNNFGENPSELSSVIVPVVDLTPLYLASRVASRAGIGSTAIPVQGFNPVTLLTVPSGRVWAVYSAAAGFSPEAGVTGSVALAVISPTDNAYRTYLSPLVDAVAGDVTRIAAANFAPLWLGPGCQIGAYLINVTGAMTAASSIEANALISEFRAGN